MNNILFAIAWFIIPEFFKQNTYFHLYFILCFISVLLNHAASLQPLFVYVNAIQQWMHIISLRGIPDGDKKQGVL